MNCPICDRDNDVDARRCRSCGADFEDPEIAAQLDRPRPDEGPDGEIDLSGGRFLSVRWLGLEAGGDLRRLALVGGALFAGCALLPVKLDFGAVQASWSAMNHGPKLALALPFVLAVVGLALGLFGRKLPAAVIAGALAASGAAFLIVGMTPMGDHAGTATRILWLPWFGTAIAAAGVAIRVLRRRDPYARWIIVGGAVLVAIGMVLPQADLGRSLPAEFPLYLKDARLADASLLTTWTDAFDHDVTIKFLSMWHLLELALLGGAILVAMMASKGPWDSNALTLRPIGFALIFHLTLTLTFYALNVVGWKAADYVYWNGHGHDTSDFTSALFAGRARLALLSLPATVWLVAGLVGLYATVIAPRLVADARPARAGAG